ncbi:MAG: hypothetical protein ACKOWF_16965 [Chloroflexota bacterium]
MPTRPLAADLPAVSGPMRPARAGAIPVALLAGLLFLPLAALPAPAAAAPRCEVPALPAVVPATPAARATGSPATPATQGAQARSATPAAKGTPGATPVAELAAAPDTLAVELDAVARSLAACLAAGDAEGVADLVTEPWLSAWFGGVAISREQFLQVAPTLTLPTMEIRSVSDVRRAGAKAAAADVEYLIGRQIANATWSFAEAPPDQRAAGRSAWRVEGERPLPVNAPNGTPKVEATLAEGALTLSRQEVKPGNLLIAAANEGAQPHEVTVLKFDTGYTLPDLLRAAGPGLPAQVEWIGQLTIPAGSDGELVLAGLDPGTYWVLCLLPGPDGMPHAGLAEAASFTVR